jgi:NAD(P)-dependent dehydrogenase (short-subunit alcohol dehydrogenase family)
MSLQKDSVVVITGAASGIGRALAKRVELEGVLGIAICDIDANGLITVAEELASLGGKVKITTHVVNVAELQSVQNFANDVVEQHGRVSHLINNAGVALVGTFDQISLEDFHWLMGVNFWGVVNGCKVFLPLLQQERSAHIVNISSVFGLIAPAEQTAYSSAKFAVRGFTESLRHELAGSNVAVSCVHPGGIKTNIVRNARVGAGTPAEWKEQGTKLFDRVARTSSEKAAETIVRGIMAQNPRILIGRDAQAISFISRLFPRSYLRILERLNGHKMSLRKS